MMCLLWYNQLVSMNVWLAAAFINHYFLFLFSEDLGSILLSLTWLCWFDSSGIVGVCDMMGQTGKQSEKNRLGKKTKRNWTTEGQSEDIGFDSDNNGYFVFQYWGISHICRLQLQSTYWWPVANIHINIFFLFFAFYVS